MYISVYKWFQILKDKLKKNIYQRKILIPKICLRYINEVFITSWSKFSSILDSFWSFLQKDHPTGYFRTRLVTEVARFAAGG